MTQTILSILGHGGFKLLILGFFFVMKAVKANAQKNKRTEAQLRGNTAISDFSTPAASPSPSASSQPSQPLFRAPALPKTPPDAPTSTLGSPWSSNQNPFNS